MYGRWAVMTFWYWIIGSVLYVVAGLLTIASMAYEFGQDHTTKHQIAKNQVPMDECPSCGIRVVAYICGFLLWPIMWLVTGLCQFVMRFENGGINSKLPPKDELETRKER
jgi:hypothetical protein